MIGKPWYSTAGTVLLFLGVLLVLLGPVKTPFGRYDEGLALVGATRVAAGEAPYRDFWTLYSPGQYYTLALVLKIFGHSVLVARLYDVAVRLAIVLLAFLIATRMASRVPAALTCAAVGLALSTARPYCPAVFPALACCLLTVLFLLRYADSSARHAAVAAGMTIGLCSVYRHDFGAYAALAVLFGLGIHTWICAAPPGDETRSRLRAVRRAVAPVVIGTLAVALPVWTYLILEGGVWNVFSQLIAFPATTFHSVRSLPYPSLVPSFLEVPASLAALRKVLSGGADWLWFYLPLATYGVSFAALVTDRSRTATREGLPRLGLLALGTLGIFLYAQASSRYSYVHVLPTALVSFVLMGALIRARERFRFRALRVCVLILPVLAACALALVPLRSLRAHLMTYPPWACHSPLARAGCVYLYPEQEQAVRFIRAQTSADEAIFVGNRRHDAIFVNDVGFHFLADRPSCTAYHELHPGVATTFAVQTRIVQDLESRDVRWIVLVEWAVSPEPNASALSSGVSLLDDFIRESYRPVARFGSYSILERRPN